MPSVCDRLSLARKSPCPPFGDRFEISPQWQGGINDYNKRIGQRTIDSVLNLLGFFICCNNCLYICCLEPVFNILCSEKRCCRDRYGIEPHKRKHDFPPFRDIREHDKNLVAFCNPHLLKPSRSEERR